MSQLPLFKVAAKPKPTQLRLGANQLAVLKRLERYGNVRVREAGRIVYRNRGHLDPSRIPSDWVEAAGLRVLLSLHRKGLVRSRSDGLWVLKARPISHLVERST